VKKKIVLNINEHESLICFQGAVNAN